MVVPGWSSECDDACSSVVAARRVPFPCIRAVELVAEQVEVARLYEAENCSVLDRPRFQSTIADGRNNLLRSAERYDIITADATHPSQQ